MNRFAVEPDQIDTHAGSLAGVSDQLSTLASVLPDSLGDQALGAFAQFLTAGLQGAMGQTAAAVAHASSSVDEVSTGLRRTAEHYRRIDDDNSATFTREYR
ncbi:type VII secretion target [Saccharothrix deserti]|uniref:type VII secretion target n=1 Tax=Saccharothrix deserti TaxID=2593674 RepID=UPI00131B5F2C|nr:type VII secretion target [Saccharothrix deserti]